MRLHQVAARAQLVTFPTLSAHCVPAASTWALTKRDSKISIRGSRSRAPRATTEHVHEGEEVTVQLTGACCLATPLP